MSIRAIACSDDGDEMYDGMMLVFCCVWGAIVFSWETAVMHVMHAKSVLLLGVPKTFRSHTLIIELKFASEFEDFVLSSAARIRIDRVQYDEEKNIWCIYIATHNPTLRFFLCVENLVRFKRSMRMRRLSDHSNSYSYDDRVVFGTNSRPFPASLMILVRVSFQSINIHKRRVR